ncbi:type 1 glutamine amidotransferase domain-containing protein [Flammeovirgaceae bacterium SG7u.111]|nr:type 1 glutamine amidotransferase domain-containing protein [Flammeovirgaceae bacterium SG7u.132]WPO37223.1 type 1 glutamine amidotransferase domain-containing protein [Flammeovirgaceae bacterium SG7u.111]
MSKKRAIIKWSLIVILSLIVCVVSFGFWFVSLLPSNAGSSNLNDTRPTDLPYLSQQDTVSRGNILVVVTSCSTMGDNGKPTGYELTELSRAYYVFQANGFEVTIASPLGGKPPVIIDKDDMGKFDYAFLNDTTAQRKVSNSIAIEKVNPEEFRAVYFAGGKGAMFDFPENTTIQSLVSEYYQTGKVVGAVCHGPAALVNATLSDGRPLLTNKTVSSFTNTEELFLIPDAETIFPFLLQDKLEEKGAQFSDGHMYLKNVCKDGNLVTGQNPWSTWAVAELMVQQLGYTPAKRVITPEENTIELLTSYQNQGYGAAKAKALELLGKEPKSVDRMLLAMHSIVAAMQFDLGKFVDLLRLLAAIKNQLGE